MALVFGHARPDLRQFPDLVSQRLGVVARELRPATSALGRLERLHVVALVAWNQRPFVFLVAGLPAAFLLRLSPGRLRPCVGMLRAGRQRGVLGCLLAAFKLLDPRFQLGNLCQQQPDDSLGFRWLAGNDFFRDSKRHAPCVAKIAPRVQINLPGKRPQGVNGYTARR